MVNDLFTSVALKYSKLSVPIQFLPYASILVHFCEHFSPEEFCNCFEDQTIIALWIFCQVNFLKF